MKRRRFLSALAVVPATEALRAQEQPAPAPPAIPPEAPAVAPVTEQKLAVGIADEGAEPVVRFFTPTQFATLRRVADLLIPPIDGNPGASDCGAPEFLDFLIGASLGDRQQVYRDGLNGLDAKSGLRFGKVFAMVDGAQADELLQPLREPWTYDLPAEPVARFLHAVKADLRTATLNSRPWNIAAQATARGRRATGGAGLYWYPID